MQASTPFLLQAAMGIGYLYSSMGMHDVQQLDLKTGMGRNKVRWFGIVGQPWFAV